MRYTVPEQDLHIDLARMPALPRSRFAMTDVRLDR
jgi:fatty-acid peroxygenase